MVSITSSKNVNPVQYRRKEFGHYYMTANQTTGISVGDPVKFNGAFTGNITFYPATYTWTLKANKTYRMLAEVQTGTSSASAYLCICWQTTGGTNLGTANQDYPTTYASNVSPLNLATATYTPTVDTDVRVEITAVSNLTTIYSGGAGTAGGAYAIIEEIDGYYPNTRKWDYEYVSPEINITTTCTDTGGTITKAVAKFLKTSDGNWSMEFNITGTKTAKASTTVTFTGISVRTTGFTYIPVTFYDAGGVAYTIYALFTSATSFTASQSTTTTGFYMYGKVPLSAKPTGYAIPSDV